MCPDYCCNVDLQIKATWRDHNLILFFFSAVDIDSSLMHFFASFHKIHNFLNTNLKKTLQIQLPIQFVAWGMALNSVLQKPKIKSPQLNIYYI